MAYDSLLDKRRAMMKRLQLERGLIKGSTPRIPSAKPGATIPATPLQTSLWIEDQLQPGSGRYNVPGAVRIRGKLNTGALQEALRLIVARHDSLRLQFKLAAGLPVLTLQAPERFEVTALDVSEIAEFERELAIRRTAEEDARSGFSLSDGLPFRATIIRAGAEDHVLLMNFHHIVTDGFSMGIFSRELKQAYEAISVGHQPDLPELPVQFVDYAAWIHDRTERGEFESEKSFWKSHLQGLEESLDLPFDHTQKSSATGQGGHSPVALRAATTACLRRIAQTERATPFEVVMACFNVFLHAVTEQDDIVVGTPMANRVRPELQMVIGYFVNMVPLRSPVDPRTPFLTLVNQTSQVHRRAAEHAELPFPDVVASANPRRVPGTPPIFQVELTLLEPRESPPVFGYGFAGPVATEDRLGEAVLSPLTVESGAAKFDLTMLLWNMPDRLEGTLEYNSALFEPSTAARLATEFAWLTGEIVSNPEATVSDQVARYRSYVRERQERQQRSTKAKMAGTLAGARRRAVTAGEKPEPR